MHPIKDSARSQEMGEGFPSPILLKGKMNHYKDTRDPRETWWNRLDIDQRFYSPEYPTIDNFHEEDGKPTFLSNFYIHPLIYKGKIWQSSEAAFQAEKTLDEDLREQIRMARTPAASKKMGRAVHLREDWEEVKYQVMKNVCRAKFSDAKMVKLLLATWNAYLIEGNTWCDNVYGICVLSGCYKCEAKIGRNILGKVLMEIRKELFEGLKKEYERTRISGKVG